LGRVRRLRSPVNSIPIEVAMNQADFRAATPYATLGTTAIEAPAEARLSFIRKTYMHLAAAIYALVGLEFVYFNFFPLDQWVPNLFSVRWGWFLLFGAYIVVSTIADNWARSDASVGKQYTGLFTYTFAFSVILCPLLWIANQFVTPVGGVEFSPIAVAAVATLAIFGVLTATVFLTRTDFSFLGPILGIASMVLMGVVALAMFGWLNLGTGAFLVFVAFAGAAILYDTSNILHHYRTDQYVAASLRLFASLGLLFWYVLQIVISFSSRR
jgi:FtsH-binding integral membrane protein